jgi:hypothetical protein
MILAWAYSGTGADYDFTHFAIDQLSLSAPGDDSLVDSSHGEAHGLFLAARPSRSIGSYL